MNYILYVTLSYILNVKSQREILYTIPCCRQKLVLLEHENKKLRLNQRTSEDEKLSVVQSLLDDAQQQVSQLRLENRYLLINTKHVELVICLVK